METSEQKRKKDIPCEVILPKGEASCKIEDVLEVWKTGFENLLNCNDNQSNFPDTGQEHIHNYIFDAEINTTELKLAIKSLKCNKAVGIDDLPAEILKCDNLLDTLLVHFNKSFTTSIIPTAWKQGIINPIPKSTTTDHTDPLNYRGITLTSSVDKF